jgi:predicted DCC family thiol-disulfide oxidoreductase YuxK
MASDPSPSGPPSSEQQRRTRAVFLYDGDCAFCTSCARVVERRIPTRAEVVPWQWVDLADLGVTQAEAEEAVIWIPPSGPTATGPIGIGRLLIDAGSYWRPLGWLLMVPPMRWLAWPIYRLVARNRHRMPGGTAACALPHAERVAARQRERNAPDRSSAS